MGAYERVHIIWDESKRHSNIVKHGLDFADMLAGFDFDTAVVVPAKAGRLKMIGLLKQERVVAAVMAVVGREAISLVSLRPASRKERELYEQA